MNLVSLNPYRTLDIPGVRYIKPELALQSREELKAADWVLFPETWQVNFLVHGLKCRIFPNLATYHLGWDKIEMTRGFWSVAPANVPQTLILPPGPRSLERILDEFDFPFVAKEPRNSMGRGVFLIRNRSGLTEYADRSPVLYVQEYLSSPRDLRVVIAGDRIAAAYWRVGAENTFHHNIARGGRLDFENIPPGALELVRRTARELGINHAGFDLIEQDGFFYFLEFNVFFGTEGLRAQGISLGPLLLDYLRRSSDFFPETPSRPSIRKSA